MEFKILTFDKPEKVRTTEEHNELYSSDCGIPGTYTPNMSQIDNERWKAKHIKGDNERIEVRKSMHGAQMVIVVYKKASDGKPTYDSKYHKDIRISANGTINMTSREWSEMQLAIFEAQRLLEEE